VKTRLAEESLSASGGHRKLIPMGLLNENDSLGQGTRSCGNCHYVSASDLDDCFARAGWAPKNSGACASDGPKASPPALALVFNSFAKTSGQARGHCLQQRQTDCRASYWRPRSTCSKPATWL